MWRNRVRIMMQCMIATALIGFPWLAYANIEAAPEQSSKAALPSPKISIDPAAVKTNCDLENWPNYSVDCVRGQGKSVNPRQIALIVSDAPLVSTPRVIEAPSTQLHIVTRSYVDTATQQETVARPTQRRGTATRATSRANIAARSPSSPIALSAPSEQVLAGW